jgi:hypothetical protein
VILGQAFVIDTITASQSNSAFVGLSLIKCKLIHFHKSHEAKKEKATRRLGSMPFFLFSLCRFYESKKKNQGRSVIRAYALSPLSLLASFTNYLLSQQRQNFS